MSAIKISALRHEARPSRVLKPMDAKSLKQGSLQGLVKRFAAEQRVWNGAVVAMSELDALMSLATAADTASAWGPVCRPIFVPAAPNGAQAR